MKISDFITFTPSNLIIDYLLPQSPSILLRANWAKCLWGTIYSTTNFRIGAYPVLRIYNILII